MFKNKKQILNQIEDVMDDIEDIKIQGATNVAKESIKLFSVYLGSFSDQLSPLKILKEAKRFKEDLANLRETEPLTRNALDFIYQKLLKDNTLDSARDLAVAGDKWGKYFLNLLHEHKQLIIENGQKLINRGDQVFTHCHSSMVTGILINAYKKRRFKVFNDETRPLFQGRITSTNLRKAGLPNTMLVDGASAYLISHFSGKDLDISSVFLGCDAIALDGACVNKVGSYGIALSAHHSGIPVYIATSLLKIEADLKRGAYIKIEEREPKEIWSKPPKGLKLINLAFDMVPPEFITAYITEFGLVKAKDVAKVVKKNYPWLG
jgi:ribose 1,5-bisphosphate isomerase